MIKLRGLSIGKMFQHRMMTSFLAPYFGEMWYQIFNSLSDIFICELVEITLRHS